MRKWRNCRFAVRSARSQPSRQPQASQLCSPLAKVAHEKFGLVEGFTNNILVGTFPLQGQVLLHELS